MPERRRPDDQEFRRSFPEWPCRPFEQIVHCRTGHYEHVEPRRATNFPRALNRVSTSSAMARVHLS
jgi:hypothetical protein